MKVLRYEDDVRQITSLKNEMPVIFLAGPTVRGNQPHLTSWRFEAIDIFAQQGFDGILVVPEFTDQKESDKGKSWIPQWEFYGLSGCDVIMFWVPRTKELIGLTTNHEHGYWLARCRSKVVFGFPPDSYRNEYLKLMWEFDAVQSKKKPATIYDNLPDTISASIQRANASLPFCVNRFVSLVPIER